MLSGVCKYCGCTEGRACLVRAVGLLGELGEQTEPCQWLDQDETICSGCVSKLSEEELLDLGAAELPLVSDWDLPMMLGGLQAFYLPDLIPGLREDFDRQIEALVAVTNETNPTKGDGHVEL